MSSSQNDPNRECRSRGRTHILGLAASALVLSVAPAASAQIAPAPAADKPAQPAVPSAVQAGHAAVAVEPPPTAGEPSPPQVPATQPTSVAEAGSSALDAPAVEESEDKAPYPRFEVSARLQTGLEHRKSFSDPTQDSRQPFFLDQARLGLEIDLNASLTAAFDAELTDKPAVRDAYVNVKLKRYFQLRAGHFKRPISRTELQGIGTLPFRARGLSSDFLRDAGWAGRSLGVMAWGKLRKPKLRWSLAAMNAGRSIDIADTDRLRGVDLLARVELGALPWLELALDGGHVIAESYPDGPNEQLWAIGADAVLRFGALRGVLEARFAQNPQPPIPPSNTGRTPFALALLGYATYDIALTKKIALQPIVAIERLDTDRDLGQDETLRAVAGLNLLLWSGKLRLLPQLEVIRPLGDVGARSHAKQTTYYLLLSLQI